MVRAVRALGTLVAAAVLVCGCSGNGGGDEADTSTSSDSGASKRLGKRRDIARLTFKPLAAMVTSPVEDDNANLTFTPKKWAKRYEEDPDATEKQDPNPPALFVFLEKRGAILGTEPSVKAQIKSWDGDADISTSEVDIPGSTTATVMKSDYTTQDTDVPSTQWDILIQTNITPEYHIRYGAPADQFDRKGAKAMLESIRVKE